jgi:hypothetical protein
VGREVALVELHALEELDLGLEALALLDGDDAVLADLVHRLGDDLADLLVLVGRAGADLRDLLGAGDLLGHLAELGDDGATAESMPRLTWLALAPAVMFLRPSA